MLNNVVTYGADRLGLAASKFKLIISSTVFTGAGIRDNVSYSFKAEFNVEWEIEASCACGILKTTPQLDSKNARYFGSEEKWANWSPCSNSPPPDDLFTYRESSYFEDLEAGIWFLEFGVKGTGTSKVESSVDFAGGCQTYNVEGTWATTVGVEANAGRGKVSTPLLDSIPLPGTGKSIPLNFKDKVTARGAFKFCCKGEGRDRIEVTRIHEDGRETNIAAEQ
jgi:hypothetical protein